MHQGRNAAAVGDLADLGRLDAEDTVTLEVGEQRAVIRADVDDQILRLELEHRRCFGIKLGKIIAQQFGGTAGVGILGREDDDGIDRQAELHQLALGAIQKAGRKPGLLPRHCADARGERGKKLFWPLDKPLLWAEVPILLM